MADRPTVLLPLQVLEGESIPEGVPELLAGAHVVLLGYHVIPEQTPTGQAEMQFEERGSARLDELRAVLEDAGATVEEQLVFTHRPQQTIDRINHEFDCDAIVVPNATAGLERVLVPVAGDVGVDQLAHVVGGLFGDDGVTITLYHVLTGDRTADDARAFLEGVAGRLVELGIDGDDLEVQIDEGDQPLAAIIEASAGFDAVVMGETDPTIATFFFGMPADQVAQRFLGPVIVIQRAPPEEPTEE